MSTQSHDPEVVSGRPVWSRQELITLAAGTGYVLSVVGAFAAVVMMVQHHEVSCSADTLTFGGGDGACYAYPQGLLGLTLVVVVVMLAVIVFLASTVARAVVRDAAGPRS